MPFENNLVATIVMVCIIIGYGVMQYLLQVRAKRIADLEDDIEKLKANRQIPTVIDGYIVYLSEYEIKHRTD